MFEHDETDIGGSLHLSKNGKWSGDVNMKVIGENDPAPLEAAHRKLTQQLDRVLLGEADDGAVRARPRRQEGVAHAGARRGAVVERERERTNECLNCPVQTMACRLEASCLQCL